MKKTPLTLSLLGLLAAMSAQAATVSKSDPVPQVYDPNTFETLSGGVGYTWTVILGGNDRASMEGSVGAWSWDEDGFPATAKGWTHTSNWIALNLTKASKVTMRLYRKLNVPTTGNDVAGNILFPAFTLYRGWDGDGGDDHTYNNQGNVAWAEDITYLTHRANSGTATSVEVTLELAAGLYSIALGGNSPSTLREPAQGYGFDLVSQPIPSPSLRITSAPRSTLRSAATVSGRIAHPDRAKAIRMTRDGKSRSIRMSKGAFSTRVTGLKAGRNHMTFLLFSHDGAIADRERIVIERRMPEVRKFALGARGGRGSGSN